MDSLLTAGVILVALSGAARAAVLHDLTACAGITYCSAEVTDEFGRPDGTIGFSTTFANGGRLADTRFIGTFYRVDPNGVARQYDDFAGVFVEVSNPLAAPAGVTFSLQGTFNKGANSFNRTSHVVCAGGHGDACVLTDLGGVTVLQQPVPLPGVSAASPQLLTDETPDRD
jgi:hypothetical protein